ncbi:hypothetical protein ANO11243_058500 [Dothideomycetidae sp. 11243]|nr:hypothetical protein ANO11243_058500 [fungal sp. No.11243]
MQRVADPLVSPMDGRMDRPRPLRRGGGDWPECLLPLPFVNHLQGTLHTLLSPVSLCSGGSGPAARLFCRWAALKRPGLKPVLCVFFDTATLPPTQAYICGPWKQAGRQCLRQREYPETDRPRRPDMSTLRENWK